jgi:hypothetical protein
VKGDKALRWSLKKSINIYLNIIKVIMTAFLSFISYKGFRRALVAGGMRRGDR